mmetsp:Transcript_139140/g.277418  ORF Transcript_139140/g.277418 Transcript_139140/m.277418 type:complete len:100 (+) Transcript_139140:164-463(+)
MSLFSLSALLLHGRACHTAKELYLESYSPETAKKLVKIGQNTGGMEELEHDAGHMLVCSAMCFWEFADVLFAHVGSSSCDTFLVALPFTVGCLPEQLIF